MVNTLDQVDGSPVVRGDADEKVAPCVDPNTHGGIGDGDNRKERMWSGAPVVGGVRAVVTTVGAVVAGRSGLAIVSLA